MPKLEVQHCLRDLETSINDSLYLLAESNLYKIENGSGKYIQICARRKELFACTALLKMFISWEDFVESSIIRYICGGRTTSGYAPMLVNTPFPTIQRAYLNLFGRKPYLNWSPSNVISQANRYFISGEPFLSAISSSRNKLDEINIVRNRFAHRSDSAKSEFETIVRNTFGYTPKGINSGRWLLMIDPAYPGLRFIDTYASILKVTARNIVP
jgi:hypothetical protein